MGRGRYAFLGSGGLRWCFIEGFFVFFTRVIGGLVTGGCVVTRCEVGVTRSMVAGRGFGSLAAVCSGVGKVCLLHGAFCQTPHVLYRCRHLVKR